MLSQERFSSVALEKKREVENFLKYKLALQEEIHLSYEQNS
jgi:hypothetical protein